MMRVGPVIWLGSGMFTSILHGGAILLFASLLHEPDQSPKIQIQLSTDKILAATRLDAAAKSIKSVAASDSPVFLEKSTSVSVQVQEAQAQKSSTESKTASVSQTIGEVTSLKTVAEQPIVAAETASPSLENLNSQSSTAVAEARDDVVMSSPSVAAQTSATTTRAQQTIMAEQVPNSNVPAQDNSVAEAPPQEVAINVPNVVQRLPEPDEPKNIDVLGVVKGFHGGDCFLARPTQDQTNAWTVRTYAANPSLFEDMTSRLQQSGAVDVRQIKRSIQDLQCGALAFAKYFSEESQTKFKIELQESQVSNGADINATISGFDKKWLYITLIDDDGFATDLSAFAKADAEGVKLTMPVRVKGAGRHKNQLLLAVSSDRPLTMLDIPEPRLFAEISPLIKGLIVASNAKVSTAIADFSVR